MEGATADCQTATGDCLIASRWRAPGRPPLGRDVRRDTVHRRCEDLDSPCRRKSFRDVAPRDIAFYAAIENGAITTSVIAGCGGGASFCPDRDGEPGADGGLSAKSPAGPGVHASRVQRRDLHGRAVCEHRSRPGSTSSPRDGVTSGCGGRVRSVPASPRTPAADGGLPFEDGQGRRLCAASLRDARLRRRALRRPVRRLDRTSWSPRQVTSGCGGNNYCPDWPRRSPADGRLPGEDVRARSCTGHKRGRKSGRRFAGRSSESGFVVSCRDSRRSRRSRCACGCGRRRASAGTGSRSRCRWP